MPQSPTSRERGHLSVIKGRSTIIGYAAWEWRFLARVNCPARPVSSRPRAVAGDWETYGCLVVRRPRGGSGQSSAGAGRGAVAVQRSTAATAQQRRSGAWAQVPDRIRQRLPVVRDEIQACLSANSAPHHTRCAPPERPVVSGQHRAPPPRVASPQARKPANVLVRQNGVVKLTDFGTARLQGDPTLTAAGSTIGTPAYMAPEQIRGLESSPATDIWGLGATLFYTAEGHLWAGRARQRPWLPS